MNITTHSRESANSVPEAVAPSWTRWPRMALEGGPLFLVGGSLQGVQGGLQGDLGSLHHLPAACCSVMAQ